jgi:hypothetical protein
MYTFLSCLLRKDEILWEEKEEASGRCGLGKLQGQWDLPCPHHTGWLEKLQVMVM